MSPRPPLWDLPVRLFHWALALLVIASFVTGKLGGNWMAWHVKSGYAIFALLLFRLAWGLAGSPTARFASFLKGPGTAIAYLRSMAARRHVPAVGHNPLGGWMVVAMLLILLLQVGTGLFADDEVATQGPLSILASARLVSQVNRIHEWNQYVILGAIVLHLAAVAFYQWGLRNNLIGPMFSGGTHPGGADAAEASPVLAGAIFVVTSTVVYCIVVLVPRLLA